MKVGEEVTLAQEFVAASGTVFEPGVYFIGYADIDNDSYEIATFTLSGMIQGTVTELELMLNFVMTNTLLPFGNQQPLPKLKCECGVAAVGTDKHSNYCPLNER